MVHDYIFVGELSDFCGGRSSVLTSRLWRLHAVTRLVFNSGVIGEGLGVAL